MQELVNLSKDLKEAVSRFKLDRQEVSYASLNEVKDEAKKDNVIEVKPLTSSTKPRLVNDGNGFSKKHINAR
jgi:hypothetical protein